MPKIELVNVYKKFLRDKLIENLNLTIDDGSYTVLCGPTGSGKTTILLMIAGLVKPDKGEIYIDGELVNDVPPEDRNVAVVFETYALFPHMNVIRNVTYSPWVRGVDLRTAIKSGKEFLEMLYLSGWENAYPDELSGGMKQRVALARALASNAKILLLDEPLGALDAKIRADLRFELQSLAKALNLTVIHATHDMEEAMILADKLVILNNGKVEQIGAPEDIYLRPNTIFVANYVSEGNFFEGIVVNVDKSFYYIDIDGITIRAFKPLQETIFSVNDHVVLYVKSEDLLLSKAQSNEFFGNNVIEGKISDISFIGSFTRFEVIAEDYDKPIIVRLLGDYVFNFKRKEKVLIKVPEEKILLYRYPTGKPLNEILKVR
ncbi:MAG: ABC transporter ATP-binding protein [Candidatus Asgardarchaeia archaeon]